MAEFDLLCQPQINDAMLEEVMGYWQKATVARVVRLLCMLEFWQDCCQKLSKSISHSKVRTYSLAQQLGCLEVKSDHTECARGGNW